jgi:hypothetical protein
MHLNIVTCIAKLDENMLNHLWGKIYQTNYDTGNLGKKWAMIQFKLKISLTLFKISSNRLNQTVNERKMSLNTACLHCESYRKRKLNLFLIQSFH